MLLNDASQASVSSRLIFLTGLHESGLHAVQHLLAFHPEIGLHVDEKLSPICPDTLLADLLPDEALGGAGLSGLSPDAHRQHLDDAGIARLRERVTELLPAAGMKLLLTSPSHALRLPLLARAFPEARFVVTTRHPIPTSFAMRRSSAQLRLPCSVAVENWVQTTSAWMRALPSLRHAHVLCAETLCTHPEPTLRALAEFLGLDTIGYRADALAPLLAFDDWEGWRQTPADDQARTRAWTGAVAACGYALEEEAPCLPEAESLTEALLAHAEDTALPAPPAAAPAPALDVSAPQRLVFVADGPLSLVAPALALATHLHTVGRTVLWVGSSRTAAMAESRGLPALAFADTSDVAWPSSAEGDPAQHEAAQFSALRELHALHGAELLRTIDLAVGRIDAEAIALLDGLLLERTLEQQFSIPLVVLQTVPTFAAVQEENDDALGRLAWDLCRRTHVACSYGVLRRVDEAAASLGWKSRTAGEPPVLQYAAMKRRLVLQAFPETVPHQSVGGLSLHATGFWQYEEPVSALPSDLQEVLDAPVAPVVVVLPTDATPDPLLTEEHSPLRKALDALNRKVVVVGGTESRWPSTWLYAEREHLQPVAARAALVLQAGWVRKQTILSLLGVPQVLVTPERTWAAHAWAEWAGAQGIAKVVSHVDEAAITEALHGALLPEAREKAERHAAEEAAHRGVSRALGVLDHAFTHPETWRNTWARRLERLAPYPLDASRQIWHGVFAALATPEAQVPELRRTSQRFFDALGRAERHYPLRKADWPEVGVPMDLAVQDLPHASSLQEWWYLHTHLETESGRPLSIFAALFERVVADHRFAHVHASVLDEGTQEHTIRSIGDPKAPELVGPLLKLSRRNDHFRQSLAELFAKGVMPAPDTLAVGEVSLPRDVLDARLGDFSLSREKEGVYEITLNEEDGFGFRLRFEATKPVILNGTEGIVFGTAPGEHMFYYSYTRMAVSGTVTTGGVSESVTGWGWYDHEFGGDRERQVGGVDGASYAWSWLGIQLEDNTELVYATLLDRKGNRSLHEDEVLFIDADGTRTYHRGTLEPVRTWSSVRTYCEYEVAWVFSIPSLDMRFTLEAARDGQELVSVIASPGYWEGRVRVTGEKAGQPLNGLGFCEQFGRGGDRSDYKSFLKAVGREVHKSVVKAAPFELTDERLRDFVAEKDFEYLLDGVDKQVTVDTMIRPVRAIVDRGGKGWRSMGMLVCADAVGGDPQELRDYLSFPEFLHTGSLIIDDIQDDSDTRRGGPSCHKIFGVPIAINAGTAAYFFGESLLRGLDLTDEEWIRTYRLYFLCMRGAHTGQAMDIHGLQHMVPEAMSTGDFDKLWRSLMSIHRLKSGLPPMIGARCGVIAAHGSTAQEKVLGDFFLALGTAFQVMDDVINLRGFANGLKEHAEDLVEGKITAPVIQAFRVLEASDREKLWAELRAPKGARDIEVMLRLIDKADAMAWCHNHARGMVDGAWEAIETSLPDTHAKLVLRAFGRFVVDIRDY